MSNIEKVDTPRARISSETMHAILIRQLTAMEGKLPKVDNCRYCGGAAAVSWKGKVLEFGEELAEVKAVGIYIGCVDECATSNSALGIFWVPVPCSGEMMQQWTSASIETWNAWNTCVEQ